MDPKRLVPKTNHKRNVRAERPLEFDAQLRSTTQPAVGRPTVLKTHNLTPEKILEVYLRTKSFRATARELGVAVNTVRAYVGKGLRPGGRPISRNVWEITPKLTGLYKWFADHRNEKLPRNVRQLAELCGFPAGSVDWFLARRSKAASHYLRGLGDLRDLPCYLVDTRGRRVPCGMLADYSLAVDRYDLMITIRGMLRFGGAVKFFLPFDRYRKLFDDTKALEV